MSSKAEKTSAPDVKPQTQARTDRLQYREMLARVRDVVWRVVPIDADVLAISRGDTGLLDIKGRRVTHFPQNERITPGDEA